jgi:outer membrane protein insertion porin family
MRGTVPLFRGCLAAALLVAGGLAALSPPPAQAADEDGRIHVEKIEIRGVKNRDSAIKSQMRIREGESYEPDEFQTFLNADTSNLFRWGIWIRRILPREPRGKITLVLEVEERIRLASIRFEGMDAFEEDEILPLLLVKPNTPTDGALIRLAADQIEEYYRDQGYRFAHVTYDLKGPAHGRRQLIFQVDEGPRTRIVDIVFNGNRSVRSSRLRSVMETKRSDLFQAERLEEAKFRRDLAALEQYYREEGWRDARVTLEDLVYSDDRNRLAILVRVDEGERYVVESIEIQGNS